jgi:hypothetical protein
MKRTPGRAPPLYDNYRRRKRTGQISGELNGAPQNWSAVKEERQRRLPARLTKASPIALELSGVGGGEPMLVVFTSDEAVDVPLL